MASRPPAEGYADERGPRNRSLGGRARFGRLAAGVGAITGVVAVRVKERLQYRFDFAMTLVATLIQSAVLFALWRAVYAHLAAPAMPWHELFSYVALAQAINLSRWSPAERATVYGSAGRVRTGDIALDLVRPLPMQLLRFAEAVAFFAVELLWVALPAWLLFVLGFGVALPATPLAALAFACSLAAGFGVAFALNSLLALAAFWTTNVHGVQSVRRAIGDILAGTLIPLNLLPHWVQGAAGALPFQAMAYVPLQIYLGRLTGSAMLWAIVGQLVWCALLLALAQLLWRFALRRFTVFGG